MKFIDIYFYIFIIYSLFLIINADDDYNEDNIFGEIIFDIMIGCGLAICETSETCSIFITIISITFTIIFMLICLCGSDQDREELYKSIPSRRRFTSVGIGYGLGRNL